MKTENTYIYSFYLGFTIQVFSLLFVKAALYAVLVVSLLNMLATMFLYPWFFVWLMKGRWSVPIRYLEPPQ
ncbi:hypothetical protein HJTV-2_gp60 [Haloarcula virus HJTV-2]|uniref:Uncharacterized protein n=1 Tax=Haloarcula virus HJTV-2 TaxID=2877986 RepID=A0AAE8XWF3_9CAUD|nr:hypothetical protein M1M33_gp087 [Haloarcula virus HJTV-2]UBF21540.1 hypothetical protein HRTV-24_gp54 [Halorubrum virus HRTV-24]UBF21809.1 hypothetical protein HSTV-3_gp49 [Halorubrum virus HSTV-3]UBF21938.1 hypothetical protein HJTV-3_gp49 [Haloarcula virus HJTV-3]UBF22067.1 hypothetical protein HRTV-15_gp48 [Halorubrum virus HRTV-15]UBF21680.1 hypothetical protein HJTV-2_gp60 [Haloarcula virus HJTV-2]